MSNAWETTSEDVENALKQVGIIVDEDKSEELHEKLDMEAIEEAAFWGDEMEEQTNYAYEEIVKQLTVEKKGKRVLKN